MTPSNSHAQGADLSTNLRLLCSFKPSIALVARDLALNRSQLNKYLNGSSIPRPALLRRIGDYFGVEVHELLMPADAFAALVEVHPRRPPATAGNPLSEHLDRLARNVDPRVQQLAGSWFEHYQSMSQPGMLLRALVSFERRGDWVLYQRVERIAGPGQRCRRHYRYQGLALMLGDRIILNDHESTLGIELTQTILYPDYERSFGTLAGLKIGISATRERTPCAARVLLQRVPPGSSLTTHLRQCGVFDPKDGSIDAGVRELVDNRSSGPHHFLAAAPSRSP